MRWGGSGGPHDEFGGNRPVQVGGFPGQLADDEIDHFHSGRIEILTHRGEGRERKLGHFDTVKTDNGRVSRPS